MNKNKKHLKFFSILGISLLTSFGTLTGLTIGNKDAVNADATNTKRIYCKMEHSWWKADGAAIGAHYWKGGSSTTWPGVRMTPVPNQTDIWYVDIDTDQYEHIIFTRVGPSDKDGKVPDWGAKTGDLDIPTNDQNFYTITSSTEHWGDNVCEGNWSGSHYDPAIADGTYLRGSFQPTGKEWTTDGQLTMNTNPDNTQEKMVQGVKLEREGAVKVITFSNHFGDYHSANTTSSDGAGYNFDKDSSGNAIFKNDSTNERGVFNIYVNTTTWNYHFYPLRIDYNANGGSGTTNSTYPVNSGYVANVAQNNFTNDGYEFTGWNTAADGSGTSYTAGSSTIDFSNKTGSVTLYAQWNWVGPDDGYYLSGNFTYGGQTYTAGGDGPKMTEITDEQGDKAYVLENVTVTDGENGRLKSYKYENHTRHWVDVTTTSTTGIASKMHKQFITGINGTKDATISHSGIYDITVKGGNVNYELVTDPAMKISLDGGTNYVSLVPNPSFVPADPTVAEWMTAPLTVTKDQVVSAYFQTTDVTPYNLANAGSAVMPDPDGNNMYDGLKIKNNASNARIYLKLLGGSDSTLTGNYRIWVDGAEYTITYDPQGGTLTNPVTNYQKGAGATLPTEGTGNNTIHKDGYTFNGWYYLDGDEHEQGPVTAIGYDDYGDKSYYAKWSAATYTVSFDKQGGTGGSDNVTATYGSAMPTIEKPSKTGYIFLGYFDAVSDGTQYYYADGTSAKNWDKTDATTLYAQWQARTYSVALDTQGGTGGTTYLDNVTYGQPMPAITLPTKDNYTFAGYFSEQNGQGNKYYNADGTSARNWDIDGISLTTLYAYWEQGVSFESTSLGGWTSDSTGENKQAIVAFGFTYTGPALEKDTDFGIVLYKTSGSETTFAKGRLSDLNKNNGRFYIYKTVENGETWYAKGFVIINGTTYYTDILNATGNLSGTGYIL